MTVTHRSAPMSPPAPPSADIKEYRNALGCFATGIAVVTAMSDEGPVGMTINSFTSVSLDPPLILWSLDKTSSRYDGFMQAQYFAINVLADTQRDVCDSFAQTAFDFSASAYVENDKGVAVLQGCVATFECRQHKCIDAGDHIIILGEVEQASYRHANSLIYAHGSFSKTTNAVSD